MSTLRAAILGLCLAALWGSSCQAPEPDRLSLAPDPVEEEERIHAAVIARLRALFPEVEGELSRESITRALMSPARASKNVSAAVGKTLAALRQGDFARARDLLDEILVGDDLNRARALIAAGDQRGALAVLDRAVLVSPDMPELLCLRGEVASTIAESDRDGELARAALADFRRASSRTQSARASLGASRAARLVGDGTAALEHARAGVAQIVADGAPLELALAAERTLAEAAASALAVAQKSDDAERVAQHRAETIKALEGLIGRAPEDPWAWRELARLHLGEGASEKARGLAHGGLRSSPEDPGLHECFTRALISIGGNDALRAAYEKLCVEHPRSSLAQWYWARARFDAALAELAANHGRAAAFEECEKGFARCRELGPSNEKACRANEALCRTGAGWCHVAADDLDLARQAFLAAEDVMPGGLRAEIAGTLRPGVEGLAVVGRGFGRRGNANGEFSGADDLERSARIFDYLHEYEPDNVDWANNAGFADRDTAGALSIDAAKLADRDQIDEANRRLARARELMEKSYAAYARAAELAPNDVRIQNDTGLILTYYLQRDVPTAERYLRTAIELGEKQVPKLRASLDEKGVDAREREARQRNLEEVESALGDAYQNMGVLLLTLKGEAQPALAWLEKSLVTGPDPREEVRGKNGFLDQCRAAIEGRVDPRIDDKKRWCAPLKKK